MAWHPQGVDSSTLCTRSKATASMNCGVSRCCAASAAPTAAGYWLPPCRALCMPCILASSPFPGLLSRSMMAHCAPAGPDAVQTIPVNAAQAQLFWQRGLRQVHGVGMPSAAELPATTAGPAFSRLSKQVPTNPHHRGCIEQRSAA